MLLQHSPEVEALTRVITAAIGPVVLISGVGLLLLTMTNRLGRIVDRVRSLVRELPQANEFTRLRTQAQIQILARRARLVRLAVTLASASVLLVALLIAVLFTGALLHFELGSVAALLFVLCMLTLIGSMGAFLREVHLSLHALELELNDS